MGKLTFSMGGVHPHDSKYARECAIEELPLPQTVYVSMAQHLGAPAKPLVAVGDSVKVGQVIAEPGSRDRPQQGPRDRHSRRQGRHP